MKLSMWMIADKLEKYITEVNILDGGCSITGVRLYSQSKVNVNQNFLIVSRVSIFLNDNFNDNSVLCIHGDAWIKFNTEDIDIVFNEILNLFDELNIWSDSLNTIASTCGSLQKLIDASREVLPFPIFIINNRGTVVAYTKEYGIREIDDCWDSIILKGEMPQDLFTGNVINANNEIVSDLETKAKIYNSKYRKFVGAHLLLEGEIIGSITMIEYGTEFNAGHCQLVDIFCQAVTLALAQGNSNSELRTSFALITDLLEGRAVNYSYVDWIISRMIGDYLEKVLILCRNTLRSDLNSKNSFSNRICQHDVPCYTMVYGDFIIAILIHGNETELLDKLGQEFLYTDYIFGVSLPFTSFEILPGAFRQANLALERSSKIPGTVYRCVDYAYDYLLELLSKDINISDDLLHPALGILARYDSGHKSDFYNTLFTFLAKERNVVVAAKSLFIHRNSMLYRLQRIEKLIDVDLNDINVRMYLLISFQIEIRKKNE